MSEKKWLIGGGAVVGILAVALTFFGNPANMGFCIACFIRDIAGGVGLHRAAVVQYIRPEIIGLVLGAFAIALLKKDFAPRGGSSPMLRFVLGFGVMVGALVFLGCPLRMAIRIGGGDLNAVVGLVGFIAGILVGIFFLKKGFTLGRSYKQGKVEGAALSVAHIGLLVLLVAAPAFIFFSTEGPGSMRAPLLIALAAGLIVGVIAQRTRLCMVGGIRDVVLFKDWTLITGFIAIIVLVLVGNLVLGKFKLGFAEQAVAHTQHLWNFLGLSVVGLGSVLLGGCPMRQLILSGEGNTDSAMAVLGMLVGAAFCHNFGLASSAAGTTPAGRIACIIALAVMLVIGACNCKWKKA
ncbi:MAG: YedE-related selenium metabolism membrane protein [Oscillospiraceae bacterium]|nr:YedE-related selenium metabolism membrane protein [Oscillospiraceae bacterium]